MEMEEGYVFQALHSLLHTAEFLPLTGDRKRALLAQASCWGTVASQIQLLGGAARWQLPQAR